MRKIMVPALATAVASIFLICILCSITGCGCTFKTDCGNEDEKISAYANKSEVTVKIVVTDKYNSYEKFIANNDTLHSSYYRDTVGWSFSIHESSIMELHFLDEPQKCLIFEGPVKDDGIDMRSWKSYKKGKRIENWADFWAGVEYVYTITTEHKAMAKESYCPLGI